MDDYRSLPQIRLIDYVIVVGVRKPTLDTTETPELLRRFPQKDHKDFALPGDVIFFCQPEGCNTVSKKFSLREANSFVFTLTEKDSGKVRYGVCVNVFRPCSDFLRKDRTDTKDANLNVRKRSRSIRNKRDICMSLTSLCLISHHPFFPTFRECLFFLRKLIDSRIGIKKCDKNDNTVPGLNSWSVFTCTEDQKTSCLAVDMDEVETWVQRLLLAQAPIPGRTRIEVQLHSPDNYPPLTFAVPESNRFPLVDFPIHIPLELLGVETCLKVLTCILLEHKVVIQSRDYNALTMSVMALTSLLYPLEYMFPVIPLLPTCMDNAEQLLLAPTPFVIGVPASFFRYKSEGFVIPGDIWVVDLDSNKITVPLTADELPPLPQPEGVLLVKNLKLALQALSMPAEAVVNLDESAPLNDFGSSTPKDPSGCPKQLTYGNDVDAIDIAVRVAMVIFFTSTNVLGGLGEHTRTLRLYPRPVVALQKGPFLKSRSHPSEFIMILTESQSLEYYGEWLICPSNTAFLRIQKGIYDPQLIGDKAKWFASGLEPVVYQVFDLDSRLYNDPWIDVDYEPSLIFDEDEITPNNDEDDDSSSCHSSVSDLVQRMISGEINGASPMGPHVPPFMPVRASSPMPDVQASFTLQATPVTLGNMLHLEAADRIKHHVTRLEQGETVGPPKTGSITSSLSSDSCSVQEEDCEDFVYSVSNPPTPKQRKRGAPISSDAESENTFASGNSSHSSASTTTSTDKQSSVFTNSTGTVIGLWNTLKKSTMNVTKTVQPECAEQKAILNGFGKRIPSYISTVGLRQKAASSERPTCRTVVKQTSTERAIQSDNHQFLKEVIRGVMKGEGVGWLASKRLRKLMTDESHRTMVANRLYTSPPGERNTDVVDDTLKFWWSSFSSLSLGWSTPSSSNWEAGAQVTQFAIPEAKRIPRSVYKGMLEVIRAAVGGFEVCMENKRIGGVSSAYQLLEIAHTHYYGRDIKEQIARLRDDDEMSGISNSGSISSLSDNSRDLSSVHSWLADTGKRNILWSGESDEDSGHGAVSDTSWDIETIMTSACHSSEGMQTNPELTRSNSDVSAAQFSQQGKALKDKLSRTRSLEPAKIQIMKESKEDTGKERCRSPALAHMKLNGSIYRHSSIDCSSESSLSIPPSPMVRKSNLNTGYRYYNGDIFPVEGNKKQKTTGRRYLFEGLLIERSSLWDNMDFWESTFLDAVANERDAMGMDQEPAEMIDRYHSLGLAEKKRLEEDEDRLLATMLYNLVAFMLALNVQKESLRRKVRRLLGKAHVGLLQSQQVNDVLDNLDNLNGNDIDLKPAGSRQMFKQSFVVHSGDSMNGDVFFMEVCDDCILLRTGTGTIVERWWYEKLVNITYCPKTKVLCLWCRQKEETILNKFCTKKCKALYYCIKESLQRAADRLSDKGTGIQLGGEFPVKDLNTGEGGLLQVTLEGIGLKFATRRVHIDLCHIRNCSTRKGVFVLDEFVPATQDTIQHSFGSQMCNQICYAVLCLFSYVAASRNSNYSIS